MRRDKYDDRAFEAISAHDEGAWREAMTHECWDEWQDAARASRAPDATGGTHAT